MKKKKELWSLLQTGLAAFNNLADDMKTLCLDNLCLVELKCQVTKGVNDHQQDVSALCHVSGDQAIMMKSLLHKQMLHDTARYQIRIWTISWKFYLKSHLQ